MKEKLMEFIDIFPHLTEKVSSLDDYIIKIQKYGNMILLNDFYDDIGICCFYNNDYKKKIGFISLIGIKKSHQAKRFGLILLNEVKEIMRKNNMDYLRLEVDDDNDVAKKFYKKNGFIIKEKLISSSILECQI